MSQYCRKSMHEIVLAPHVEVLVERIVREGPRRVRRGGQDCEPSKLDRLLHEAGEQARTVVLLADDDDVRGVATAGALGVVAGGGKEGQAVVGAMQKEGNYV